MAATEIQQSLSVNQSEHIAINPPHLRLERHGTGIIKDYTVSFLKLSTSLVIILSFFHKHRSIMLMTHLFTFIDTRPCIPSEPYINEQKSNSNAPAVMLTKRSPNLTIKVTGSFLLLFYL